MDFRKKLVLLLFSVMPVPLCVRCNSTEALPFAPPPWHEILHVYKLNHQCPTVATGTAAGEDTGGRKALAQ
ncbi:hypothetical protein [Aquibium oceanicum]|uniref:hypothetical protein n=1 Tax=Aquibium oceanicum TaxID=1670800 RepID=UPI00139020F2|nr:hypothetical protein [Aquibium oceanicum]